MHKIREIKEIRKDADRQATLLITSILIVNFFK